MNPTPSNNFTGKHYVIGMLLAALVGSVGDLIPLLDRLPKPDPTPEYPSSGFEEWLDGYLPDVTYTAGSDGFVVAYGHSPDGKTPDGIPRTGSGVIEAGGPGESLRTMTRFGPGYQGALLAVPKGYSWRVGKNETSGDVVVRWLPVKPS